MNYLQSATILTTIKMIYAFEYMATGYLAEKHHYST